MTESTGNERRSIYLLRWIGYGLLVLALFNIIELFIPLRLMNPIWELHTIGLLVERVVVPLLGLGMVFYGQTNYREDWEIPLLKGLSWACLLVGVLFVLLIPMGINDTVQLYSLAQDQFDQRSSQIQEFKTQLNKAEGKELESLLVRFNPTGASLPMNDSQKMKVFKKKLLTKISQTENTVKSEGKMVQGNQIFVLLKNSIKSNLGAVICGILFIRIWRLTRWARRVA